MRITSSSVCAALLGTATAAAVARPPADEVTGTYIVELDKHESPAAFYARLARDHGIEAEHRMDLASRDLFHGASFRVPNATASDHAAVLAALKTQAQAGAVWPLRIISLDVGTPGPHDVPGGRGGGNAAATAPSPLGRRDDPADHFSPHVMTQIDRLHARGLTGKGFRIAVVDSGIDYTHPALGGCFGPGCLVEMGWDLVGDAYSPPNLPVPDADPYDGCVGHGTHVAGTIAAQLAGNAYNFTGAAPGVKLSAYRAWGCPAKATTDVLIAAFLRAFDDGNDIISCSDGSTSGWSDDPWSLVVERIVAAGVPVVMAAANDGGWGLFSVARPAGARGATAVGAVENSVLPVFVTEGEYTVSGAADDATQQSRPFGFLTGTPAFPEETKLTLWAVGNETTPANNACGPLPADTPDLADKLVLLRMPDAKKTRCYPIDQGQNVADKGGRYVAFIVPSNNSFDEQYIYVDGIKGVISVAPFQGAAWLDALSQGANVSVTVPGPEVNATTLLELEDPQTGGYMATFSSWGPTWELRTAPQVASPGGKILSTYPMVLGGYRIMSGTSMATPLIAGVLALLGEARGSVKDTDVLLRRLANTAKPNVWFDGTQTYPGLLAPVAQQGAGMVQAYDAAFGRTALSTYVLSVNDTEHFVGEHRFAIENTGTGAATYRLSHLKSTTMYTLVPGADRPIKAAFPNPTVEAWAALRFDPETITVPAGGKAEVAVTVTPPEGVNATLLPLYSGYVAINSTRDDGGDDGDKEEHLVLPYLGAVGSMRATPILLNATSFLADFGTPAAANRTYTLPVPDPARLPYLNNPDADPKNIPSESTTPNFLLAPVLGPRALHIDVVALDGTANDGKTNRTRNGKKTPTGLASLGPLAGYPQTFVPRPEQRAYFQGMLADGTVLPAGAYRLVASALRIFGDAAVEGDWDVIESVPFVVRYEAATNGTTTTTTATATAAA